MYLSTLAFLILTHSASVFAQTQFFDVLTSPPTGSNYPAGSVLPISWTPGDSTGTISIVLNGGSSPLTLQYITTVAKSIDTKLGGLNWTIPSGVGSFATYGLNLTLDSDSANTFQSSFPFHITGGTAVGSDTSSSSSGSASATATASSSATGSGTASTSASGTVSSTGVIQSTSSATFSTTGTTSAGTTLTTSSSTGFLNGTATKTSSSTTSGTSSSSTSSSTVKASGAAGNVVSASLALLAALAFAVAL
ncbi:hypothetical protein BDZ45DRAFT_799938 [Acephala macrosclerotiorum]|nr:hypothetical protein BDZ45DRAFT_799938 [Acephala macrosclerotiorum]